MYSEFAAHHLFAANGMDNNGEYGGTYETALIRNEHEAVRIMAGKQVV